MFKKLVSILLFVCIIVTAAGCNNKVDTTKSNNDSMEQDSKQNDKHEEGDKIENIENELSSNNEKNKIVKFWGGTYPEECGVYDEFKEATGYTIENKVPECDDKKLLAAIASGAPPDVLFIGMGSVPQLAANKAIRPIDDYLKQSDVNLDEFYSYLMDLGKYEGKHYSMPWDVEFTLFYWDKDLFEKEGLDPNEPPKTWEELKEYSKLLTKYNSKGELVQCGMQSGKGWSTEYRWYLDTLVMSNGGSFLSADGKHSTFNTPEVIGAFDFLLDLSKIYGGEKNKKEENQIETAMWLYDAVWGYGPAQDPNRNIGVGVPPCPEGKERVSGGWATWALVLPEKSANPEGGFEFAKYMATEGSYGNVKTMFENDPENFAGALIAHMPSNKEINKLAAENCKNEHALYNHKCKTDVFENYVKPIPKSACSIDVNKEIDDFWNKLWDEEITIQDGVQQIDKKLNSILDNYYKDRVNMGISDE